MNKTVTGNVALHRGVCQRVVSIVALVAFLAFGVLGSFLLLHKEAGAKLKEASDLNNSVVLRYFIDTGTLNSPATDVYVDNQEDISKDIVIPDSFTDEYGTHYVESLGYSKLTGDQDSFFFNSSVNLRSVIDIDASQCSHLKRINDYAFYKKSNIIDITLPLSLQSIGTSVSDSCPITTFQVKNSNIQFLDNNGKKAVYDGNARFTGADNSSAKDFTGNVNYTKNDMKTFRFSLSYPGQDLSDTLVRRDFVYLLSTKEGDNTSLSSSDVDTLRQNASLVLPSKAFYDFAGYYDQESADGFSPAGNQVIGADGTIPASLEVTKERTLYAAFTPHVYSISYEGDVTEGEKEDLLSSYTYGTKTSLKRLSRPGYEWNGWYTNASFTGDTVDVLSETDHGDLTLYPKMTPITYTIAFDGNGADSGSIGSLGATYEKDMVLSSNVFSRTGYTFGGWNTKADGSGDSYADGDSVKNLCTKNGDTVTLYAQWIPQMVSYKINYTFETVEEHKGINIEDFSGKDLALAGDTVTVSAPEQYGFETPQAQKVTVKGDGSSEVTFHYTRKYFTISVAGGDHPGIASFMDTGSYKYGTMAKVTVRARDGYSVATYTYSGQDTQTLPEGTPATQAAILVSGDTTITATAVLNTYGIQYHVNDGTTDNALWLKSPVTSYNTEQEVLLPGADSLKRKGYTFAGWYTDSNFTLEPVTKIAKGEYGEKAFYGKWKIETYTITYIDNGGSIHGSVNTSYQYREDTVVTLPSDVTREGYAFGGWYDNAAFTGDAISAIPAGEVGNKTFYAKWLPKTYTITYHTNQGVLNSTAPKSYVAGEEVVLPTEKDVTKKGYRFLGWYENDSFTGEAVTTIPKSAYGDKVYYALYSTKPYTITYDTKGGTIQSGKVESYEYGSFVTLPTNVTRKGYSFLGWWDGIQIIKTLEKGTYGNVTLLALWQDNSSTNAVYVSIDKNQNTYTSAEEVANSTQIGNYKGTKSGYYYNDLTITQKKLYETLYRIYHLDTTKGKDQYTGVSVLYSDASFTDKDFANAQAAFLYDHPEIFWLRFFQSTEVMKNEKGTYQCTLFPVEAYEETLYKADLSQYNTYFTTSLKAIGIKSTDSAYTKIKKIYDYVIKTYSYDNLGVTLNVATSNDTRSAGRMLYTKTGCCEAYSKIIKLFCDYYNLNCILVSGEDHMWNQIKIGKTWYALDATWDDEGSKTHYTYFLKGKKVFGSGHHKVTNTLFADANGKAITAYGCPIAPAIGDNYTVKTTIKKSSATLKKGQTITSKGVKYQVLTVNPKTKKGTIAVTKPTKKTITTLNIPDTIKKGGITCTITTIKDNAFKDCKKLKTVTIGKNVTKIGKNAFQNDKKLKKITLKGTTLKSIGTKALKGIHKKATIQLPKKNKKALKKRITKATGYQKSMKIK